MQLTITAQVSIDGVMQGPGAPIPGFTEPGGFDRDGWAHFDDEAGAAMDEIFGRADAFLFGRRTYEAFARSWGSWPDPGDSRIWTALHTKPKYVASTTLKEPGWSDTLVLDSDVAATVASLKGRPGRELQVHASADLFNALLDDGLIDQITLFTFPVVVGQGKRMFAADSPETAFELLESRSTPSGITIDVYRPAVPRRSV
jgi:dihydrofolate reductase